MKLDFIDGDNSFLLIVDIQERLARVMERRDEVIKNTKILIELAKLFEIPIIVTEQYPEGLGGTVEEIKNSLGEPVKPHSKRTFSAYTGDIKKTIDSLNRKKAIVVGMETHICVYQTVLDMSNSDYDIYLVKDACCSRAEENRQNGFELIDKLKNSLITNTETLSYEVMRTSDRPEFKKILELIK